MAELGITCPRSTASSGSGTIELDKRILVRTGGCFEKDTPLSLDSPGPGWAVSGDLVTYSGGNEFTGTSQVFHNGDLQQTAATSGTGCDVYFVSASGSTIAFGFNIDKNDAIQVWKFASASGTA
jgi:hypothetical protein